MFQGKAVSVDAVLTLLSVGKVEAAAETAVKNRDFRLAICLTQILGQESMRPFYLKQLSQWFESKVLISGAIFRVFKVN